MKKTLSSWRMAALVVIAALAAGAVAQKKHPPAQPIDLNAATVAQLQQLPGIGANLAKAIVNLREKSGPFRRVEDLLAVPHITRRTIEKIRPYVTVGAREVTKAEEIFSYSFTVCHFQSEERHWKQVFGNGRRVNTPGFRVSTESREATTFSLLQTPFHTRERNRADGADGLGDEHGPGEKPCAGAEGSQPQNVVDEFCQQLHGGNYSG